jgi:SAM-dependent methyltransferase
MGVKRLLHAGCGSKINKPPPEYAAYKEIRLDANKLVEPDIVASLIAMPMIDDDDFDAIFCSHVLEHLYSHEVAQAMAELFRVLKPGGEIWIQCPDLQAVGGKLALDQGDAFLYRGGLGPVSALDLIYGHRASVGLGNSFMAHKTGFTSSVLSAALGHAGFTNVKVDREIQFELRAKALKPDERPSPDEVVQEIKDGRQSALAEMQVR